MCMRSCWRAHPGDPSVWCPECLGTDRDEVEDQHRRWFDAEAARRLEEFTPATDDEWDAHFEDLVGWGSPTLEDK